MHIDATAKELAFDMMRVAGAGKLCGSATASQQQREAGLRSINEILHKYFSDEDIETAKIQIHRLALEALVK